MAFSKAKSASTITVAFTVQTIDERTGSESSENVVHVFRRPSIKERELYRQTAHTFKNGKSQLNLTRANLQLWNSCIEKVEGYEDLPENDFRAYFQDEIGMAHADAATRIMLDKITETEAEIEKNSD